jgi:hypothetical protein
MDDRSTGKLKYGVKFQIPDGISEIIRDFIVIPAN